MTGLRPAQLEQLEAAFAEIDGGAGMGQKMRNDGPKETITTNIDPSGAGKNGQKKVGGAAAKKQPTKSKYDEDDEEENDYNNNGGYGGGGFGGGGAGPVSG